MISTLSFLLSCAIIFSQLWYQYIGLIYLASISIIIYITLYALRKDKLIVDETIRPLLSKQATELYRKYYHVFDRPLASRDFGAACALHQFVGIVIIIICSYQGLYWTLPLGVVFWFLFAYASVQFNPIQWLERRGQLSTFNALVELHSLTRSPSNFSNSNEKVGQAEID